MSSGCTVATLASIESGSGSCSGGVLMFGPRGISIVLGLVLVGRREDVQVVDVRLQLRHLEHLGRVAVLARVADLALDHRHRRDGRRAQVDAVVVGAAAAGEVAVHRAQRVGARRRRLAHADARPADRLEHAHAALDELAVDARLGDRGQDLARPRRRRRLDRRVHDLAVLVGQHGARQGQVQVAGVDRRAHAHLGDLGARDLLDRDDVAGRVRLGDERAELAQVDLLAVVVLGVVVGAHLLEVVLALLALQPLARLVVGREDGRGGAQLGDHVRDRPALGDRPAGRTSPGPGLERNRPWPPRRARISGSALSPP